MNDEQTNIASGKIIEGLTPDNTPDSSSEVQTNDTALLIEKLEENKQEEIKVEPLFESKDKPLNAGEVGRPTILTDELCLKMRTDYLNGLNYVEIREKYGIGKSAWDSWYYLNIQAFREKVQDWKHEKMISDAEETIHYLMHTAEDDRVKLNASTFIAETLGKAKYSKRTEQTGANGGPVQQSITGINYIVPNGDNPKTNS